MLVVVWEGSNYFVSFIRNTSATHIFFNCTVCLYPCSTAAVNWGQSVFYCNSCIWTVSLHQYPLFVIKQCWQKYCQILDFRMSYAVSSSVLLITIHIQLVGPVSRKQWVTLHWWADCPWRLWIRRAGDKEGSVWQSCKCHHLLFILPALKKSQLTRNWRCVSVNVVSCDKHASYQPNVQYFSSL